MKKLLRYTRGYRIRSVLAPIFKMLEAASELFVPLVMADIIDVGIASSDKSYVVGRCLILVALAALGLSFTVTAQYFSATAAVGFVTSVKKALVRHILSFEYAEIDRQGTASLLAKMTTDASEVQNGVNLTLRLFMRSPFIVIGAAVMAFTVDPASAVTFVIVIPVLAAVVFTLLLASIPIFKKVQKGSENLLFSVKEHLSGVRVIRSFGLDEKEKKKFDGANSSLTALSAFAGKISALMNPLTYVIINLGIVALLYRGGVRVENGDITLGQLVALYNYMSQILIELLKMANLIISISRSLSAASRIEEVFETSSAPGGDEPVPKDYTEAFCLDNVTFTYSGDSHPALSGVSLSLPRGGSLGIIGATGSGKTTLIDVMTGFYPATDGEVFAFGKEVGALDRRCVRRSIHRVPQHSVLFSGTVRDNLLWAQEAGDDELNRAASSAMAKDFLDEKDGLDTVIGEGGAGLSGGQRQRLAIARALVGDPEVLILDDSFSALDPATDRALRANIAALPGSPTLIIASQRASSVMSCDKIIVLEDGEVVGYGTHGELLDGCGVYREIFASQFGAPAPPGKGAAK